MAEDKAALYEKFRLFVERVVENNTYQDYFQGGDRTDQDFQKLLDAWFTDQEQTSLIADAEKLRPTDPGTLGYWIW